MAKPFDAALKHLLEKYPADWLSYLLPQFGIHHSWPVEIVDANLSTITTEADKVLHVKAPDPWLLHLELQASKDRQLVTGFCNIMCCYMFATICRFEVSYFSCGRKRTVTS